MLNRALIIAAAAALLCLPAAGQTLYRYVDSNGAVHYSDKPLIESTGRAIERISRTGTHLATPVRSQTAAASETQAKSKDAAVTTEERRNLALLATYNSLKEIDDAQAYALRDARRELRDAQSHMVDSGRLREQLQNQVDGYGSKPAPAELMHKLTTAELEFKSLASLVEAKRREVQSINERYEEDRRRYAQLLGRGQVTEAEPAAAAPAHN